MWFIVTHRSEFRSELKENCQPNQHCWHCLAATAAQFIHFYWLVLAILSVQKSNKKKIQQCWYRLSTKKGLFQEKQELYTWTLLMKNRKLEIFPMLILGTKGKLLSKQKTQQTFLSSPKPVSPHLSHQARIQQSLGAGIQAGHREVTAGECCGPAASPPALFCMAFPSADVPAVWLSHKSSDLLNVASKQPTCSEIT